MSKKKKTVGKKPTLIQPIKSLEKLKLVDLEKAVKTSAFKANISNKKLLRTLKKLDFKKVEDLEKMPMEVKESTKQLKPKSKRFHGVKLSKAWFPFSFFKSKCRNRFGYMTPFKVRKNSRLPFNVTNQVLLGQLGALMGDPGREQPTMSNIPAGYTYFGQFVDHDITLDISSSLDSSVNANTISNMRTPKLDLDCVYGRGPALDPHMYQFPSSGPSTAIKLLLGRNSNTGNGGSSSSLSPGGMGVPTDADVPRMNGTNTAAIGDPRNDENLIVSQFQMTMLKFHNNVVDMLVLAAFPGDIFVEAQKIVQHHYQWVVLHDFLERTCGTAAVNNALANVHAPVNSAFRMPVEFSVAAYRFGHSMIRNQYWINFNFPNASLNQVFQFVRNPQLPVFSNWVVDFNAFANTGNPVPPGTFNMARKIDSVLANGLESLPGFAGLMAIIATRNLRRALSLGLPSGQATATHFGITPLTNAQLVSGLPANEVAVLNANGGRLLNKTPLWYYILREAAVLRNGNQLGPVGAKIVADTFVRMLKRDGDSILNVSGGFTPSLPSISSGNFTLADIINFSGVNMP